MLNIKSTIIFSSLSWSVVELDTMGKAEQAAEKNCLQSQRVWCTEMKNKESVLINLPGRDPKSKWVAN